MARGGKRAGAGRKPGSATKRTREVAEKALEEGISPLTYMLKVMRDARADKRRRDDMAKAAAPFMHARLQASINPIDPTKPPTYSVRVSFGPA